MTLRCRRRPRCSGVRRCYFLGFPPPLPPPLALPKVAVTDLSPPMVMVQVEVPEHAPLQPVKVVRLPALAVSVTVDAVLAG